MLLMEVEDLYQGFISSSERGYVMITYELYKPRTCMVINKTWMLNFLFKE